MLPSMNRPCKSVAFSMRLSTLFISLTTALTTLSAQPVLPSSHIKAGFAERDITPEIGMEQPGGYGKAFHRTFHDPCKVRVALFDDGKKTAVVIGLDLLVVPRQIVLEARAQIEKATGIKGDAVMIAASHSHSSGPSGMVLPGEYDGATTLVKKLAYEESSCADAGFLLRLTHEIVSGVVVANQNKVPVRLSFGFGHEDKVAFNRRLRMKNGQSWTHPGAGNPDILEYAGPIDPQVGVIGAWDMQDQLVGTVVNYSCHGTTNPGGISANWIQYLESTIRGALDTHAPVVFMQGACGDITQVDNLSPYQRPKPEEWSRLVGGCVGAEAVRVLLSSPRTDHASVDTRQEVLTIKRRRPSDEHVREAENLASQPRPRNGDPTPWLFAKETLMLDYLVKQTPAVDCEIQCIKVGPACFVSNPSEYFVQYGLDIKKSSHHAFTFPCELANGIVGYVPTEEAFGPHGGGYETRLTSYSNLEITAGTQMARKGIELANQMSAEPRPEPLKAPAFLRPWTYGNVPPELK